jgi:hypothetical protein
MNWNFGGLFAFLVNLQVRVVILQSVVTFMIALIRFKYFTDKTYSFIRFCFSQTLSVFSIVWNCGKSEIVSSFSIESLSNGVLYDR